MARCATHSLLGFFLLAGLVNTQQPPEPSQSPAVPAYDIALNLNFSRATYSGRETVRYVNTGSEPLREIYFLLYPNTKIKPGSDPALYIQNVTLNGAPATFDTQRGPAVRVALPRFLKPNEEAVLTLEFLGKVPALDSQTTTLVAHFTGQISEILDGSRRTSYPPDPFFVTDDVMVLADFHPVLAIRRPVGWRVNVRPSVDDFTGADAADYQVEVRAPPDISVFTSGALVSSTKNPSQQVLKFAGQRLRDFVIVAGPRFRRLTQTVGEVRIESAFLPEDEAAGRRALDVAAAALAACQARIGPSPYSSLSLVEAPLPTGLMSIEGSGLIVMARAYYVDFATPEAKELPTFIRDSARLIQDALEFAVAYGVARQWWGLAVGFDPERAHYLDNALAAYSAILYYEGVYGRPAAEEQIESQLKSVYRVYRMFGGADRAANQPVTQYRSRFQYAAVVHAKGALFFDSVRRVLGDEAFLAAWRRFYERHRYTITEWPDLLSELNGVANNSHAEIAELHRRWMTERWGDQDIGRPEYRIVVSAGLRPSEEDRPSAFERLGRLIARQMTRVGKYATKPF